MVRSSVLRSCEGSEMVVARVLAWVALLLVARLRAVAVVALRFPLSLFDSPLLISWVAMAM